MNDKDRLLFTSAAFAGLALSAFALFSVREKKLMRRMRAEERIARQREKQFRIIMEQSGKYMMRYDIPSATAHFGDTGADGFGGRPIYENAVEAIIKQGFVDPSCEEDYRAFFAAIDAGTSPITADILMVRPGGERRWYKHSSTTIFDDDGSPSTAIISYYDNTEQRERALAYAKWQQELDSLPYDRIGLYEWNLTKDVCDTQRGMLAVSYEQLENDTFNARTRHFSDTYVHEDDRPAYAALMNREHLIAMYFSKTYHSSMEYRFVADDGSVRWRQVSVQLVPYPDNQDIKAYVKNMDIDREKREELALVARSQHDFLTGAFNRETFIERVNRLFSSFSDSSHALLMLDVDHFKVVNDALGHDAGDGVLRELVRDIRGALRTSDIVGRMGGDEFVICLPDMCDPEMIGKKAEQLCTAARRRLDGGLAVSVSIGIAVYPDDGRCFEALYRRADSALYYVKGRGRDGYAFCGEVFPCGRDADKS